MPSFNPKSIEIYFNEKFPELRFAASGADRGEVILLLVHCAKTGRFIGPWSIENDTRPSRGTLTWIADLKSWQLEDFFEELD